MGWKTVEHSEYSIQQTEGYYHARPHEYSSRSSILFIPPTQFYTIVKKMKESESKLKKKKFKVTYLYE